MRGPFVFPCSLCAVLRRLLAGAVVTAAACGPVIAAEIDGAWSGSITAPEGRTAEIYFVFGHDEQGHVTLSLTMPVMHLYGIAVGPLLTVHDGRYDLPPLDASWRFDGDVIRGVFAIAHMPMQLTRGGTPPSKPAPPHYPPAPPIDWSYALGAPTWASPVLADGVIHIGASDGSFHAVCAADGSRLWRWNGAHRIDGQAVVAADAICLLDGAFELVCLNPRDGTLRWRTPLHDAALAGGPVPDNLTFNRRSATPLILDGVVYCGSSDGGLYALDAGTGRKLWRHAAGAPVFSGIGVHDDALLFGTMDGSIVMLDRATRRETMRVRTGRGVVTTPIVVNRRIVAGSRDYRLYGFDLADGRVAWTHSYWFSWVESTPVVVDGVGYVGSSDYRRVTAFDPADGKALWAADVRGLCWGSPVVSGDVVCIGTAAQNIPGTFIEHAGGIVAMDRATGAVRWRLVAAPAPEKSFGGYAGTMACDGARLYAAGFDGNLIALPLRGR